MVIYGKRILIILSMLFLLAGCGKDEHDFLSYCGEDVQNVFEADELPIAIHYGIGGEGGYTEYETTDEQLILDIINVMQQLEIQEQTEEYAFDANQSIGFVMKDGEEYWINFNNWRLESNDCLYTVNNIEKLIELVKQII